MIWKDAHGIRHLPDGRRADLVIETAEVDPAETDALEIIAAQWKKIGIAAVARAQPRQAARQRVGAGVTVMSLFYGLANGLATADSSPRSEEHTSELQSLMRLSYAVFCLTNNKNKNTKVLTPQ